MLHRRTYAPLPRAFTRAYTKYMTWLLRVTTCVCRELMKHKLNGECGLVADQRAAYTASTINNNAAVWPAR